MGTKNYDSATDMITFSRASGGTALRKVSYGNELVTNGDFASGTTGWTTTGTVIAGQLVLGLGADAKQTLVLVEGNVYRATVDLIAVGGNPVIRVLGESTKKTQFTPTDDGTTGELIFRAGPLATGIQWVGDSNDTATIDNVSVKEVTFDQADGTLELFNHPANIPRIEYDATGAVKGLLIEEARTNLLTYSNDFTDASWVKARTSALALDAIGPDGQANTAVTLVDNSAGGSGSVTLTEAGLTVSTSTVYTYSLFAKADQLSWFNLGARSFTTPANSVAFFDLSSGSIGTVSAGLTANIENVGGGWYRCSITFTTDATDTVGDLRIELADTDNDFFVDLDGTSSILIYGAQFELGSFPTSYIPTSGASASRAADIATIPTSAFGFNSGAGTVVVEAQRFGTNNYPRSVMIDAGNENNSIGLGAWGTNTYLNGYIVSGGVVQAAIGTGSAGTSAFKNSLAYKENDFAASRDGLAVVTDTSGVVPTGLTTLRIGRNGDTPQYLNGHIKSIQYYPRRLSNAQLQELTT